MGTALGNYVAGGNAEGLPLPSPPRERTPEEIEEWRARNEEKSRRTTGIVRRTDQTAASPAPVLATADAGVEPEPSARPKPTPAPKPTPKPAPVVDDRRARDLAIITAYVDGDTIPDIARARGHSTSTVRRVLLDAGVELRDDRKTKSGSSPLEESDPGLVDRIRELAATGRFTSREVADELGMSRSTLTKVAARNGITFAHQSAQEAARVSRGFDAYRQEMEAAGATAAILRAYGTATGMKVGKVGIPGRAVFTAWLEAGRPDLDHMPDPPSKTDTQPAPVTEPPPEPAPAFEDLAAANPSMGKPVDPRPDPRHRHIVIRGPRHLTVPPWLEQLPESTREALTHLLDLIELARLANAHTLKAALESAGARIASTICPDTKVVDR